MNLNFKKIFPLCILIIVILSFIIFKVELSSFKSEQKPTISSNLENSRKFVIPAETCKQLFGCEPTQFYEFNFDFYDESFDLRDNATVNSNGELVLVLTKEVQERWREIHTYNIVELSGRGIYIGNDYTSIVIEYENKDDLFSKTYDAVLMCNGLLINQILDGVDISKIGVNFSIKNAKTKKTIYSTRYPDSPIEFNSKDYDL